ncbi:MAG: GntR family transcriptional regulator [Steroidobacteraceae bacterium]
MPLELDGEGPLVEQLARNLKQGIRAGRYPAGTSLPATRALAATLGLSRNTVLAAYELLCGEGLAVAQHGSGTRVASLLPTQERGSIPKSVPPQSRFSARIRTFVHPEPPRTLSAPVYDLQGGTPPVSARLQSAWRRRLAAVADGVRGRSSRGFSLRRRTACTSVGHS